MSPSNVKCNITFDKQYYVSTCTTQLVSRWQRLGTMHTHSLLRQLELCGMHLPSAHLPTCSAIMWRSGPIDTAQHFARCAMTVLLLLITE